MFAEYLWFGKYPAFGIDFLFNIDQPSRTWVQGGDPYAASQIYPYPPLVHRIFSWTSLASPRYAMVVFDVILALCAVAGALYAWKTRTALAVNSIPLPCVLAAVLFSFPVVFAIERGNYDLLSVPIVIAALWFLDKASLPSQVVAGILLSLAPWLKVYPGLLAIGLLGLRKWWALLAFVASMLGIGLLFWHELPAFIEVTLKHINMAKGLVQMSGGDVYWPWQHAISLWWSVLWNDTIFQDIPGEIIAMLLLLPLLYWVSINIYRCKDAQRLSYPLFIWILALATFVPVVSNDYSLVFLPMVLLALWDRHDPLIVHLMIAPLLLWWQPLDLHIDGLLLFVFKYFGLLAASYMLVLRSRTL